MIQKGATFFFSNWARSSAPIQMEFKMKKKTVEETEEEMKCIANENKQKKKIELRQELGPVFHSEYM